MPIDPQELEDLIADTIADSFDMDWIPRDAARAIMRALASEGWAVVEAPPTSSLSPATQRMEKILGAEFRKRVRDRHRG